MSIGAEHEARKVLTVLFVDITGSTPLGEELDFESLRHMLSRYFEEMRLIIERHEGVVAKFIGDAVMALFGAPRVHEDDALRAVRAAVEMRETLDRLNEEFGRTWGVQVMTRTGVNTGEVLAGDPEQDQSFVVGDAVNVAARLEQTAEPGEILIGENTYRLVRAAVEVEPMGPLALKGKGEPVPAWRLLNVTAGVSGWSRRLDSPFVGRERELAQLEAIFDRTASESAAALVTVMGAAGVGKSRLTREFLLRLGPRVTVVKGRCLSYGQGITFWPIAAVLRDAADIEERDSPEEARRRLSALLGPGEEAAQINERLSPLLGLSSATPGIQETFWAVRRLFEVLSAERPVVVLFDDVHWGESTFLELLEYLADRLRGAVVLLALARPELLERPRGWMPGKSDATLIALGALTDSETDGLIRNLVGGDELVKEARDRIAEVAEGNPLFVEETLRMLIDDGVLRAIDGRWALTRDASRISIPLNIHALLSARLDRLDPEERAVIERASVVGRSFWWGAVSELSAANMRPRVPAALQSLMRSELIRPEDSELKEEDAFRFAHILVRDAAYRGIPKASRAEMHERLAGWLEVKTRERAAEYEEIVGHHLEQAYRSLVDLGPEGKSAQALGARAAERLASAGHRAFDRGDMPAAVSLLSRAASLLPAEHLSRLELLPELAFALMETGDFARLQAVVEETQAASGVTGDARLEAHAIVLGLWIRLFTEPEGWADEAGREAARAISLFEKLVDQRGLARGWSLVALVHMMGARNGAAEQAWEQAAAHAHAGGSRRMELESLAWVPLTVWAGSTPTGEAIQRCGEVLDRVGNDKKARSSVLFSLAALEAGLGHFAEARRLLAEAKTLLEEVGLPVWIAGPFAQMAAWAELLAGNPAAAERELRQAEKLLSDMGEVSWLSTVVGILGEAVYAQGRYDEAERYTELSEEATASDDVYSGLLWRSVRAKVLARLGRLAEAERLGRESAAIAEAIDFVHVRWHVLLSLAEVLQLAGRLQEAIPLVEEAVRVAEQKGNRIAARQTQEALGRLRASQPLSSA